MFQSAADIQRLFGQFNGVPVMIIGDVMIDTYLRGKVDRISPEAPVPVVALEQKDDMLGGAANVALNIKSLGAIPILCSVIGNDSREKEFIALLEKESISAEGILPVRGRITTTKYRIIGNRMQMLRVDHETDADLDAASEEQFLDRIKSLVSSLAPAVIILQDYNKGVLTAGVIRGITELAAQKNIPVVVDPKKKNFDAYRDIRLFKPNLKELREGLKTEIDHGKPGELGEACRRYRELKNISTILVTLSDAGVYYNNRETSGIIKAHVRSVADVSGAGDTVISVAALCLAKGCSDEEMASLANLAGGLVCEEVGVVPVNKDRLLQEATGLLVRSC